MCLYQLAGFSRLYGFKLGRKNSREKLKVVVVDVLKEESLFFSLFFLLLSIFGTSYPPSDQIGTVATQGNLTV